MLEAEFVVVGNVKTMRRVCMGNNEVLLVMRSAYLVVGYQHEVQNRQSFGKITTRD
jgi:hypothetical protein